MSTGPYTKARRQAIVKAFAVRHNGTFNPKIFLDEVRREGRNHPAHGWFEWDLNKAAYQYQLDQVRAFTQDLKVSFRVEEVTRASAVRVTERVVPLVMSPMSGRRDGGGYVLTNPDDPDHMDELCRQAASSLRSWIIRYESVVRYAKGSTSAPLPDLLKVLDEASSRAQAA